MAARLRDAPGEWHAGERIARVRAIPRAAPEARPPSAEIITKYRGREVRTDDKGSVKGERQRSREIRARVTMRRRRENGRRAVT